MNPLISLARSPILVNRTSWAHFCCGDLLQRSGALSAAMSVATLPSCWRSSCFSVWHLLRHEPHGSVQRCWFLPLGGGAVPGPTRAYRWSSPAWRCVSCCLFCLPDGSVKFWVVASHLRQVSSNAFQASLGLPYGHFSSMEQQSSRGPVTAGTRLL